MSSGPILGRLADFSDGAATPAIHHAGGQEIALVVVRRGTVLHAYLDLCPHMFLPLTYRGGQVLSADGKCLRCTSHGAEFAVSDGRALSGPGSGCGLSPASLCVGPGRDSDGRRHAKAGA